MEIVKFIRLTEDAKTLEEGTAYYDYRHYEKGTAQIVLIDDKETITGDVVQVFPPRTVGIVLVDGQGEYHTVWLDDIHVRLF